MAKKRKDGYIKKTFTVNGKQFTVYGHTAAELFDKEKQKREEIEKGITKRRKPTVSEYYERWTKARQNVVTPATLRTQDKIFNIIKAVRIESAKMAFGEIRLADVNIDDLRTVQEELAKTRKTQSVNDYMAFIKHILSDALKERLIEYNPGNLLNNLKRTEEKARDTHHRALTIEEVKAFFESEKCKKSYYYNVFRLAICTGMRAGEIGALKLTDIKDGIIHIERTITRIETGAYIIGESAKTEAGRRIIPMNEQIKEIIASQKELNALIDNNVIAVDGLLFRAAERGLLMATPLDREIKRICTAANIKPFTMHAFRATFATRAIESGMNPKTLQEIMGHSSFNITMSLYGHALTDTKKSAMESLTMVL